MNDICVVIKTGVAILELRKQKGRIVNFHDSRPEPDFIINRSSHGKVAGCYIRKGI